MKKILSKHQKKFRFLLAGSINTAVGLSVYPAAYLALEPLGFGYIEVLIFAQIFCITFSFITNKYYAFRTVGGVKIEYMKFFTFHIFYVGLNLVTLPVMVDFFKINPVVAQTLFTIPVIISSYFWHDKITFASQRE